MTWSSLSSPGSELGGGQMALHVGDQCAELGGVHRHVTGRTQKPSLAGSQVHNSPRRLSSGVGREMEGYSGRDS